jgi:hypothetical protein
MLEGKVLVNRVQRKIFKTDEVTGEWRRLHNQKLYHQIQFGLSNQEECDGRGMCDVWVRGEILARF